MHAGIWIFLGGFLTFIAFQLMRGVRVGKRERKRLEALFERVSEHACPLCTTQYGAAIQSDILISFTDDDQLPAHLANVENLSTWRITCPHCRGIVLLAENEDFFELLKLTHPKPEERSLSPLYLTIVVLLTIAVIGVSVYSLVRFFTR